MDSLFILSVHSREVLVEKHWRKPTSRAALDTFWEHVNAAEVVQDVPPVVETPKYFIVNVLRSKLFFLCTLRNELPPLLVVEFLQRMHDVFMQYFQSVDESTLKENFSTVYQVVEEMCDYGYPVITEPNSLMDMVKPPTISTKLAEVVVGRSAVADELPGSTVSNVPWRRKEVSYTQNDIYFDIIEEVNCIIDRSGKVVHCDVNGQLQCLCRLSGVPDISMRFVDPNPIGDYSLHPCVRYTRFDREKMLSFVPPDGLFTIIQYQVDQTFSSVPAPVYCNPQLTYSDDGGTLTVMLGSKPMANEPKPLVVEGLMLTIPFPKTVLTHEITTTCGAVSCDESSKVVQWKIGSLPKDNLTKLSCRFKLNHDAPRPEEILTLHLDFKVNAKTLSGIKVDDIKLHNVAYKAYRGVRSCVKSGRFQIRV